MADIEKKSWIKRQIESDTRWLKLGTLYGVGVIVYAVLTKSSDEITTDENNIIPKVEVLNDTITEDNNSSEYMKELSRLDANLDLLLEKLKEKNVEKIDVLIGAKLNGEESIPKINDLFEGVDIDSIKIKDVPEDAF